MAKKDITYRVDDNGCHICTSHKPCSSGYFKIGFNGGMMYLHRYMYMQKFGEVKKHNVVRHTCDNKLCINTDHLIEGTYADNVQDMMDRNRHVSLKGANHYNTKLTEQQVLEIFNNTANTSEELSQKYKVNSANIRKIKTGRTWKHLTNNLNV